MKLKSNPFWKIAFHKKNTLLFSGAFSLNAIAALFEGASYALLLLAFSALSGAKEANFMIYILGAVGAQFLRSGTNYFAQILMTFLATRIQTDTQKKIYEQIFRLSFRCASSYKVGDLVEYSKAPMQYTVPVIDAFNRCLVSSLVILVSVAFMLFLSFKLTLMIIALFGMVAFSQKLLMRKIRENSKKQTNQLVSLSKHSVQSFQGLRVIFTFNLQENALKKLSQTLKRIASATIKLNLWNHFVLPFNEIVGVVLVGFTLIMGSFWLSDGSGTLIPALLTFLTLTYRLSSRLHIFMVNVGVISMHVGPLLRLEKLLRDDDKEFIFTSGSFEVGLSEAIVFDDVSLKYPLKIIPAVEKLNFTIHKGDTIALVGTSGAGKSTIIDLLLRLYEPTEGSIRVDGRDLRELNLKEWRGFLGVVSQDSIIFNESIQDNICLGNLEASQADVEEAARLSGAHDFIMKLPESYNTVLGERGYRLSGGERQRIALARAIVRNPDILILDEATSSLDSHSEAFIQKALERLRGEKTLIIVAHRLSTVTFADRIYVLHDGEIIEEGSHEALLDKEGRYAQMWKLQSGREHAVF